MTEGFSMSLIMWATSPGVRYIFESQTPNFETTTIWFLSPSTRKNVISISPAGEIIRAIRLPPSDHHTCGQNSDSLSSSFSHFHLYHQQRISTRLHATLSCGFGALC